MHWKNRAVWLTALLILTPLLLLNCNVWTPRGKATPGLSGQKQTTIVSLPSSQTAVPLPVSKTSQAPTVDPTSTQPVPFLEIETGEPAGCRTAEVEHQVKTELDALAYADQLLGLPQRLSRRVLDRNWDPHTQSFIPSGAVLTLSVGDVQTQYVIQRMMNALQAAGFITWLRTNPQQGLHILAISVRGIDPSDATWAPYVQAYWESPLSVPQGDRDVIPVEKVPPCRWMAEYGFPAQVRAGWWSADAAKMPDYAQAAAAYLASTNEAAIQVARRIDWLGEEGREGPNTMCGPLAWAIMHDAGALPPGYGGWSVGSKAFWLAKPRTNGRPWSLFPAESYRLYSFREPLGQYDFSKLPLYPGDFIYTYSRADGFDHMLLVTEVDDAGNVYTVTNKIQVVPEKQTTIERLLLLNLNDPTVGIARNQWANDRVNGRTGHAGFDVFRWAWLEKDQRGQAAAYTVQPGDTLEAISALWKTPAKLIARYNEITAEMHLMVGQKLQIPPNNETGR